MMDTLCHISVTMSIENNLYGYIEASSGRVPHHTAALQTVAALYGTQQDFSQETAFAHPVRLGPQLRAGAVVRVRGAALTVREMTFGSAGFCALPHFESQT
jgi:hypothetical protein